MRGMLEFHSWFLSRSPTGNIWKSPEDFYRTFSALKTNELIAERFLYFDCRRTKGTSRLADIALSGLKQRCFINRSPTGISDNLLRISIALSALLNSWTYSRYRPFRAETKMFLSRSPKGWQLKPSSPELGLSWLMNQALKGRHHS